MTEPNYKEVHHYEVDSYALDRFIQEIYGQKISIAACLESPNDTVHDLEADPEYIEDEYDKQDLEVFLREGESKVYNHYALPNLLLSKLAADGHIPSGNWLVSVCW